MTTKHDDRKCRRCGGGVLRFDTGDVCRQCLAADIKATFLAVETSRAAADNAAIVAGAAAREADKPTPVVHADTAEAAIIRSLRTELRHCLSENSRLRGLLANGSGDCIYCGLPAADMNECERGFPGCSRADDMFVCEEPSDPLMRAE